MMNGKEFQYFRRVLKKSQKGMAQLLGIALKTVGSYEQGIRNVPAHIDRQIFFLVYMMRRGKTNPKPCWHIMNCPIERVRQCPAWKFRAGDFCWLINETICNGAIHENWHEKMKGCRSCEVFTITLQP
jgi:DNA-binding XRE family transcriptional regulator